MGYIWMGYEINWDEFARQLGSKNAAVLKAWTEAIRERGSDNADSLVRSAKSLINGTVADDIRQDADDDDDDDEDNNNNNDGFSPASLWRAIEALANLQGTVLDNSNVCAGMRYFCTCHDLLTASEHAAAPTLAAFLDQLVGDRVPFGLNYPPPPGEYPVVGFFSPSDCLRLQADLASLFPANVAADAHKFVRAVVRYGEEASEAEKEEELSGDGDEDSDFLATFFKWALDAASRKGHGVLIFME
jgi:hypothetical protein